ncbi:MAG: alpha-galactosidase [Lachnospiraceae bacterium]|nr:alpha-galactosidase [Lachnospiraceae bacterium]
MIIIQDGLFVLNTKDTTYAFRAREDCGCLEHLYYGRKIRIDSLDGITEQRSFSPGNTINYEEDMPSFSLEDLSLEFSTLGKGDIREPMVEARNSDGSNTLDLRFEDGRILSSKHMLKNMPSATDDSGDAKTLEITCRDECNKLALKLYYSVYYESNVIIRSAKLINEGEEPIRINRMLSMLIDFDRTNFVFTTFAGAWAREMKKYDVTVNSGKFVNSSYTGTSSNRSNPFVMLSDCNTTENSGECYGFNLIYSGNHYESVSVNSFGKTRFIQGINPQNFEFIISSLEEFESPEAVMTYSHNGFNSLSHNLHDFVNEYIVRGKYKKRVRPVLLNSWEASYFNIDSKNLYKLAKAASELGVELFVMDDGWFGNRNDDSTSLGDWDVNEKKLPGGLKPLVDKIKALGLDFGIWVEPEMVNVNSELFMAHPDWTIDIDYKPHSEGRHQRLLDLTCGDVQDYIIDKMSALFESADISYVKWDMNRIFSDVYSKALPCERQGEVLHRYVLGLYRIMKTLTEKYPDILFEGCASGGNRFDLGILSYFPQIWASDNTDALCRAEMQNNYTYGYPLSSISAHVSDIPNHQTLRRTPLETRFNVASFAVLGYECNVCDLSKEERDAIKEQIALYKEWREVFQYGKFYRGRSFENDSQVGSVLTGDGNIMEWTCVSADRSKAVGMIMQKLLQPNAKLMCYKPNGLGEDAKYRFFNNKVKHNIKDFGNLINTIVPVHIRPDSLVHNVAAHFVKLDGAYEEHVMYGDTMMYAGVKLKQSFSGTGYNENVRVLKDFGSDMFFMVKED